MIQIAAPFNAYAPVVLAMGATAALFLIQMLVLDVSMIGKKHVPGTPVVSDHKVFFFRATRAHTNTNESIAAFILLALFGMLSHAGPTWLGNLAWVYVAGRVGHMLFYYADLRAARSLAFGVSLAGMIGMLVTGALPWLR